MRSPLPRGRSVQPQARQGRAAALVLGDDGAAELLVSQDGATPAGRQTLLGAGGGDAATLAQAVDEALDSLGARDWPLAIVLPSSWCLAAAVDGSDLRAGGAANRREALLYRFEEELPLAAEEMVADFFTTASGSRASNGAQLGVATSVDRLEPLLAALESRQLIVPWIIPEAVAILQELWDAETAADADAIALTLRDGVEVFLLRDGLITSWYTADPEADAVLRGIRLHTLRADRQPRVVLEGMADAPWLEDLDQECAVLAREEAGATSAAAPSGSPLLRAVQRLNSGEIEPWINLRRDAIVGGDRWTLWRAPLQRLLVSLLVLALSVSGACLARGWQYAKLAEADEAKQQAEFRKAYPNQPAPLDVRVHLERQHQRLRGLGGFTTLAVPQQSALLTAYEALRRLPMETRFRLIELRFSARDFVLEGQGRSHGDADLVAAALRKHLGFTVETPRTEQLGSGEIGFIVTGRNIVPGVTDTGKGP